MLRYLFFFLFVAVNIVQAQYAQTRSYLQLRANFGLGSDWLTGSDQDLVKLQNEQFGASLTWGLGFSWQYELGQRSLIDLGLNYQRRSVMSDELSYRPFYIDPYYGYVYENQPGTYHLVLVKHDLEIPLRWTIFGERNRVGWYAGFGLITTYRLGYSNLMRYAEGEVPPSSGFLLNERPLVQLQASLALGYRWGIAQNWFLDLGIQGQHSLSPERFDVPNKNYQWLTALEWALIRKL